MTTSAIVWRNVITLTSVWLLLVNALLLPHLIRSWWRSK